MKNYKEEFYKLLNLVKARDPFAFSRFSDGEVTVLRNKQVVIAGDHFIQHDIHGEKKFMLIVICLKSKKALSPFIINENMKNSQKLLSLKSTII